MANPTLRELGTFLGQFVPGAGVADAAGYYPASDKGYNPSLSDNWKAGNYGAASLQALGALADVIPGAGPAAKMSLAALGAVPAIKTAAKVADAVAPEAKGIIAYHGSPHSFDRFDLSKIGTGEGAQAYGHGLYFADSEDVAKSYRDNLSRRNIDATFDGRPVEKWPTVIDEVSKDNWRLGKLLDEYGRVGGDYGDFVRRQRDWYRGQPEMEAALSEFEKRVSATHTPGSMYQVRINADPEHFLDWDKPLSEQPEVAKRLGYSPRSSDEIHTEAEQLFAKHGQYPNMPPEIKQRIEELQNELDSRVPNMTGEQLYTGRGENDYLHSVLSGQKFTPDQSAELKAKGIPGIKYLDQGSRAAGDGSRNYVVFDDKLIEIMKKYGLAGIGLGLPAFAAMQGAQQQPQGPSL